MTIAFSNKSQCSDFAGSNATKTTLATTATNDLVVACLCAENTATVYGTPSGHSLTYTSGVTRNVSNRGNGAIYVSGLETSGASGWTLSETVTTSLAEWGLACAVFSGCASSAIGATAAADFNAVGSTGALSITTTAANSAVVWMMVDWQAADHSTRVYQTVNSFTPAVGGTGEIVGVRTIGQYSVYAAYWPDVGAAGAKTVGTTTEQYNGGFVMMAVELKAAAGGGGPTARAPRPRLWLPQVIAADRAARW